MIEDTLKQVNIYLDKQIKTLREENARLNSARITDMDWAKDQCDEIVNIYIRIVAELKAEKAALMEVVGARGELIDELEAQLHEEQLIVKMKDIQMEQLKALLNSARREANGLAETIHRRFYSANPEFELCDSVAGVITQIDNMVAGLFDRIAELEAQFPKVVVPCYVTRLFTYGGPIQGFCPEPCNGAVNGRMVFCPICGSKLNWGAQNG